MVKIFERKGQLAVEYVVILIIVMGALLAMQMYFKRGIQGRVKSSVDSVGEQYDPLTTEADVTQRVSGETVTTITVQDTGVGRQTMRSDTSVLTETKQGFTRVDAP